MQTFDLLIVLGSTVGNDGVLSKIATERLDAAFDLIQGLTEPRVILTGGFGSHFNKTKRAYSLYAQEYLLSKGLDPLKISAMVPSLDTVEDATLTVRIVDYINPSKITVLTSDFHLERVKYIFGAVFSGRDIAYVSVPHVADDVSMRTLKETENYELSILRKNGESSLGSVLLRK
jgi:uncharacterized SAM-binding protein YcdF (DUF218 family)